MRRVLFLTLLFFGGLDAAIQTKQLDQEKILIQSDSTDENTCYYIHSGYDAGFKPTLENLELATYDTSFEVEGATPFLKVVAVKDGIASEPAIIAKGYTRPDHVSQEVWNQVAPHFLPVDHPMKEKLDEIFCDSTVITSDKTMKKAGFGKVLPRKYTHVCVCKHPELKDLIIKLYLHAQRYHNNHPEHYFWLLRIKGVNAIREMVEANGWEHIFSTPNKWIYPIPPGKGPQKEFLRKNFIVVEDDMHILPDAENHAMWKSDVVDTALLDKLYDLTETLGLHDCTKPANIPFCHDGRIAFIDTQTVYMWPVLYKKLLPFLTEEMKEYWKGRFKS